jgi:hypothetical protein
MLPDPTLPPSLLAVSENLRWVFTAPSFATFAALATGLIANTGVETVTGMLTGAGLARTWPHDRAHAFFSRAAWSSDTLGLYLSRLIVVIWYTLHGHHPADAADRREAAPSYTSKAEPAFADMAAKLRRVIIAARFTANAPLKPTDAEIRAAQRAWAQAGLDLAA